MSISLIGRKCGMTRVFNEDGLSIPVSVIEVPPNRVTQIKTMGNDGYDAIQVTVGEKKVSRVNKPLLGHYKKAGTEPGFELREFHLPADSENELQVGSELNVGVFTENQFVDVTGISKGKGYAGTVKRYNFATQDATHGNSLSHRAPGSTGQNQTPGRVFKGKKMAGQMGNKRCTAQNLQIVKVDAERNLLLIKGAIPGAPGRNVVVKPSVKKQEDKK